MAAAAIHVAYLNARDSDSYGRGRHLARQCREVLAEIERFAKAFSGSLPPQVEATIQKFIADRGTLFQEASEGPDTQDERSRAVIVFIAALKSELEFLLSDTQKILKLRSELALAHLQRSIAADPDIQKKWRLAFSKGETACEMLGSAHLLGHGIFPFKASGPKSITDLVFQEPLVEYPEFVEGLVLTEWKKATEKEIDDQFEVAKRQSDGYAPGVLSGNELTAYRYLVVVTDGPRRATTDENTKGVTFRRVVISVNPLTTSAQAKKKS